MNSLYSLLTLIALLNISAMATAQIPKGHFLDADDTAEKGFKIKPFKQKKEGIYHYAVLSELPFENNCDNNLPQEAYIECSEDTLQKLIRANLNKTISFKGNVYVYLTVTKEATIKDVSVKTYPKSYLVERLFREATEQIQVKPGKFKKKTVISRLWTRFNFE